MRTIGYCTECHRVRYIAVSSAGMASLAAKGVPHGTCTQCEREADEKARRERDERERRRRGDQ